MKRRYNIVIAVLLVIMLPITSVFAKVFGLSSVGEYAQWVLSYEVNGLRIDVTIPYDSIVDYDSSLNVCTEEEMNELDHNYMGKVKKTLLEHGIEIEDGASLFFGFLGINSKSKDVKICIKDHALYKIAIMSYDCEDDKSRVSVVYDIITDDDSLVFNSKTYYSYLLYKEAN